MDGGYAPENFFLAGHRALSEPPQGSETRTVTSSQTAVDACERFWISAYNYSLVLVITYCFTAS